MPNSKTVRTQTRLRMKRTIAYFEKALALIKETDELFNGQSEMWAHVSPAFVIQVVGVIDFSKAIYKEM